MSDYMDLTELPCPPQEWLARAIDVGFEAEPLFVDQPRERREFAEGLARHILSNWAMVCQVQELEQAAEDALEAATAAGEARRDR